jgi:hypothetical protein
VLIESTLASHLSVGTTLRLPAFQLVFIFFSICGWRCMFDQLLGGILISHVALQDSLFLSTVTQKKCQFLETLHKVAFIDSTCAACDDHKVKTVVGTVCLVFGFRKGIAYSSLNAAHSTRHDTGSVVALTPQP